MEGMKKEDGRRSVRSERRGEITSEATFDKNAGHMSTTQAMFYE